MKLRSMHPPARTALALGLTALAIAGCGHKQGAPIPAAQAADLISRLQEAQRRSDARACHDLKADTIPVLQRDAQNLPQSVDSNIRATVQDGIAHLNDLVQQQCAAQTPTTTTTTPTTTTPTNTTTTPTTTTPTHTTTTPTNTTTTPTNTNTTPTTTTTTPGGVTPGKPNTPAADGQGQGQQKEGGK